jgi:hypothetical protein
LDGVAALRKGRGGLRQTPRDKRRGALTPDGGSGEQRSTMNERFDAWTKELGAQHDRRGVFKAATVGALGMLGLPALNDGAQAKQCKNNNDCNNKKKCKGGKCVKCTKNSDCKKNQKCKNNKCKKK